MIFYTLFSSKNVTVCLKNSLRNLSLKKCTAFDFCLVKAVHFVNYTYEDAFLIVACTPLYVLTKAFLYSGRTYLNLTFVCFCQQIRAFPFPFSFPMAHPGRIMFYRPRKLTFRFHSYSCPCRYLYSRQTSEAKQGQEQITVSSS